MGIFWFALIIQGVISGGFCAYIASQKNKDSSEWFVLGFLFSILAVLALIAIPNENNTDQPDITLRTCPYCAERIKKQAIFCRFCQKDLPVLNHDSETNAVDLQYSENHAITSKHSENNGVSLKEQMRLYNQKKGGNI